MSIILAEAEKGRLINVFQAFAMNIYESLLTCLQKSDGSYEFVLWWCGGASQLMVSSIFQRFSARDPQSSANGVSVHPVR